MWIDTMMVFTSELPNRIESLAISRRRGGEERLDLLERSTIDFEVSILREFSIPTFHFLGIAIDHIIEHPLEVRTLRDIHTRSIGDLDKILSLSFRWSIVTRLEKYMEHIVLIGRDIDLFDRESHLHRIVSGECISEIPRRHRERNLFSDLYRSELKEFRIGTKIVHRLCEDTGNVDRVE